MPQCKACNEPYTDHKDSQGLYVELCPPCDGESKTEMATEMPLGGYLERPTNYIMVLLEWSKVLRAHDFSEGLGLMAPYAREVNLRMASKDRFWKAIDSGATFAASVECALGTRRFRGDQRNTKETGDI